MKKLDQLLKNEADNIADICQALIATPEINHLISKLEIPANLLSFNLLVKLEQATLSQKCQNECPGLKQCQRGKLVTVIKGHGAEVTFETQTCAKLNEDLALRGHVLFDNFAGQDDEISVSSELDKRLKGYYIGNSEQLDKLGVAMHYYLTKVKARDKTVAYCDVSLLRKDLAVLNLEQVATTLINADVVLLNNIGKGTINADIRDQLLIPTLTGRKKKETTILLIAEPRALRSYFLFNQELFNDYRIDEVIRLIQDVAR